MGCDREGRESKGGQGEESRERTREREIERTRERERASKRKGKRKGESRRKEARHNRAGKSVEEKDKSYQADIQSGVA